jgi:hypothetical protein
MGEGAEGADSVGHFHCSRVEEICLPGQRSFDDSRGGPTGWRMADGVTIVAGLPIPSTSPAFLAGVAVHVALGLCAVATGALAMLSPKGQVAIPWRPHLLLVAGRAGPDQQRVGGGPVGGGRSALRIGSRGLASAAYGRHARRVLRPDWRPRHVVGMGVSYIVMLTAFYVDNGKNLPVWRSLPAWAYWVAPERRRPAIMALALHRTRAARWRQRLAVDQLQQPADALAGSAAAGAGAGAPQQARPAWRRTPGRRAPRWSRRWSPRRRCRRSPSAAPLGSATQLLSDFA